MVIILQQTIRVIVWGWILFCLTVSAQAQSDNESKQELFQPLILDEDEMPVEGVTILNTRTAEKVITDRAGAASVTAIVGDSLKISLHDALLKEYVVGSAMSPMIILSGKRPVILNNKEVRLLNKTSLPSRLTAASTQAIYNNDVARMPVTNIRNVLAGQMAGIYTQQLSGQPGADGAIISLRGQNPLILIDGIPRAFTVFDFEEVESVTLLKDALSAAMLGVRGSKGAILITTRKGTPSRQRISFTVQSATQQPLKLQKPLHSYDYARLYNEALINDGIAPVYTDEDLQKYSDGSDPYHYPNVNWQKEILKSSSQFTRYSLNATGGNQFARYFVSLEHFSQAGLLKEFDTTNYRTNNSLKSYSIRSNIDIDITPKLRAGIYLFGRILNGNEPGATLNSVFNSLRATPNNAYPILNPNGTYGGTQRFQNNILAQATGSGYRQNYKRDVLSDFYLKRSLDEITQGLWIRATGSYFSTISEDINRSKSFAVYQLDPSTETYTQFGTNTTQANANGVEYQRRSDYMEIALGYNRNFGVHGFDAIVLANRDNEVNGFELPYTIKGMSGRVSYNFKEKYIAEVAFGLNGSNRYPPEGTTKYGLFPSVGLGWNITEEKFMQPIRWLNHLKLFGSLGKTGWDSPGNFTYIQRYFDGAGATFGTGAGGNTSINELTLANPNITWEKSDKLNIGLQGTVLNNNLGFTIEYYNATYYDLLMQRGKNSSIIGNLYPDENIGKNRYTGWDIQLTWQQTKKDISYFISVNAGIQHSEVLYMDEVFQPYPWMKRTGRRVGQLFGYLDDGLFQTQDELDNAATVDGYIPQLGDIKYRDLNSDGVINQLDQAPITSEKRPLITYGVNTGFNWRFFDFRALIQGVANRYVYVGDWAFQNNGFGPAYEHHLNRWTPENAVTATYPRLNVGTNVNNHAFSTYWIQTGTYLRLKFIEAGFTIPSSFTDRIRLQSVRLFVNGTNLFTKTDLERYDPEGLTSYPVQKTYNAGVTVKL